VQFCQNHRHNFPQHSTCSNWRKHPTITWQLQFTLNFNFKPNLLEKFIIFHSKCRSWSWLWFRWNHNSEIEIHKNRRIQFQFQIQIQQFHLLKPNKTKQN
jgi:hypothetical protein